MEKQLDYFMLLSLLGKPYNSTSTLWYKIPKAGSKNTMNLDISTYTRKVDLESIVEMRQRCKRIHVIHS